MSLPNVYLLISAAECTHDWCLVWVHVYWSVNGSFVKCGWLLSLPLSLNLHVWAVDPVGESVWHLQPLFCSRSQTVYSLKKISPWSVKSTRWAKNNCTLKFPWQVEVFRLFRNHKESGVSSIREDLRLCYYLNFCHSSPLPRTRHSKPPQGADGMTGDKVSRDLMRWVNVFGEMTHQSLNQSAHQ